MSRVNRNQPKRSTASESRQTVFEFEKQFPDDAACLDFLMAEKYPGGVRCEKCRRVTKHYRDADRPSFQCEFCGTRVHPMVGTIFENSATSLRLWFYAMYLMASTRCGISAKQIERELGVTYKTAWRMFNRIRSLLSEDGGTLAGTVEMDEMYWGGEAKWKHAKDRPGVRGHADKQPILGMAQRGASGAHGRVIVKVVPNAEAATLLPDVEKRVLPESMVYTDEWKSYDRLGEKGYKHSRVRHSQEVYVTGDVHTNTIEGFWSLVRRGISGAYHSVSTKWLPFYLDEYAFRYNNRGDQRGMFRAFLDRAVSQPQKAS